MQFSANSFYDPARRAITPTIVSSEKLPLATTLDSFAWSLVGAVGASLGGFAVRLNSCSAPNILSVSSSFVYDHGNVSFVGMQVSHMGPNICFVLDAVTYIIAAYCAFALKVCPRRSPFKFLKHF